MQNSKLKTENKLINILNKQDKGVKYGENEQM